MRNDNLGSDDDGDFNDPGTPSLHRLNNKQLGPGIVRASQTNHQPESKQFNRRTNHHKPLVASGLVHYRSGNNTDKTLPHAIGIVQESRISWPHVVNDCGPGVQVGMGRFEAQRIKKPEGTADHNGKVSEISSRENWMCGDVDLVRNQTHKRDGADDNEYDDIAGVPPAGRQTSKTERNQEHRESSSQQKCPT